MLPKGAAFVTLVFDAFVGTRQTTQEVSLLFWHCDDFVMRHNEIRDTFANLRKDLCFDVELKPKLQRLEGESFDNKTTTTEDEARFDIKANGLLETRFNHTTNDVKIFNHANSCPRTIKEANKLHEAQKRLKYEQRIVEVENGSFNLKTFRLPLR